MRRIQIDVHANPDDVPSVRPREGKHPEGSGQIVDLDIFSRSHVPREPIAILPMAGDRGTEIEPIGRESCDGEFGFETAGFVQAMREAGARGLMS